MLYCEFYSIYTSKIMHPFDVRKNRVGNAYQVWIKYRLAQFLQPKSIVEIGVRGGYSAWGMLMGAPTASYAGFDVYPDRFFGGVPNLGKEMYELALKNLAPYNATLTKQDSQDPAFSVPSADLYHVDGDHRYIECLHDLRNCLSKGAPTAVVAVHDYFAADVKKAVEDAAKEFSCNFVEVLSLQFGDVIIGKIPNLAEVAEYAGAFGRVA